MRPSTARLYSADRAFRPQRSPRPSTADVSGTASVGLDANLGIFGCLGGIGGWGFGQVFLPGELPGLIQPWTTQNPPLKGIATYAGVHVPLNSSQQLPGDMQAKPALGGLQAPWQSSPPARPSQRVPPVFGCGARPHWRSANSQPASSQRQSRPQSSHVPSGSQTARLTSELRSSGVQGLVALPAKPKPPSRRRPVGVIREELLWSQGAVEPTSSARSAFSSSVALNASLSGTDGIGCEASSPDQNATVHVDNTFVGFETRTAEIRQRTLQLLRRAEDLGSQAPLLPTKNSDPADVIVVEDKTLDKMATSVSEPSM